MSELKPCPFCGGEAELVEPPCKKCHPYWTVECQGCGLMIPGERRAGKESAIDTWNTRATSERDVLP